jgi:hypothetical protein
MHNSLYGGVIMITRFAAPGAMVLFFAGSALADDKYAVPAEVTPALRSACEADVRRLCSSLPDPTVANVKRCIAQKFFRLGQRCQAQIVIAGLKR